jgi:Ni/Fe-hydrogenase subunit HybB-like protein
VNAYLPSLVEWGVALGVLGYALMLMSLGLRYLPLFGSRALHDSPGEP